MYDFEDEEDGRVILGEEWYKKFCLEYERWMTGRMRTCGEPSFRTCIKRQVASFRKMIQTGEKYIPYSFRSTDLEKDGRGSQ